MRVLTATSELLYLLEAVEGIAAQFRTGVRKVSLHQGFAPAMLSVELRTSIDNTPLTTDEWLGPNGRMVQLAYLGWIAAVDGAWEKYRTNPPYEKSSTELRRGQQADRFGDLHKIRNDLLKNAGIAQDKNCGKCAFLKWFEPGERIHLSVDHVLEFLFHLGGCLRNHTSADGTRSVDWCLRKKPETVPRIIANRVSIEPLPEDRGTGFALLISILFADGIVWAVEVRRAHRREELAAEAEALRAAPVDRFGAVIHPRIGRMNVPETYSGAWEALQRGEVPFDPGSPWIKFA